MGAWESSEGRRRAQDGSEAAAACGVRRRAQAFALDLGSQKKEAHRIVSGSQQQCSPSRSRRSVRINYTELHRITRSLAVPVDPAASATVNSSTPPSIQCHPLPRGTVPRPTRTPSP